jgi:hypothetical protein
MQKLSIPSGKARTAFLCVCGLLTTLTLTGFTASADARKITHPYLPAVIDTETLTEGELHGWIKILQDPPVEWSAIKQIAAGGIITQINQSLAAGDYKNPQYGVKIARDDAKSARDHARPEIADAYEQSAAKYDAATKNANLTQTQLNTLNTEHRQITSRNGAIIARAEAKTARDRARPEIADAYEQLAAKYDAAAKNANLTQTQLKTLNTEYRQIISRSNAITARGDAKDAHHQARPEIADAHEQLSGKCEAAAKNANLTQAQLDTLITEHRQIISRSNAITTRVLAKIARDHARPEIADAFEQSAAKYDAAAKNANLTQTQLKTLNTEQRQIISRSNAINARADAKKARERGGPEIADAYEQLAAKYNAAAKNSDLTSTQLTTLNSEYRQILAMSAVTFPSILERKEVGDIDKTNKVNGSRVYECPFKGCAESFAHRGSLYRHTQQQHTALASTSFGEDSYDESKELLEAIVVPQEQEGDFR